VETGQEVLYHSDELNTYVTKARLKITQHGARFPLRHPGWKVDVCRVLFAMQYILIPRRHILGHF
jgi:hypothetical protein